LFEFVVDPSTVGGSSVHVVSSSGYVCDDTKGWAYLADGTTRANYVQTGFSESGWTLARRKADCTARCDARTDCTGIFVWTQANGNELCGFFSGEIDMSNARVKNGLLEQSVCIYQEGGVTSVTSTDSGAPPDPNPSIVLDLGQINRVTEATVVNDELVNECFGVSNYTIETCDASYCSGDMVTCTIDTPRLISVEYSGRKLEPRQRTFPEIGRDPQRVSFVNDGPAPYLQITAHSNYPSCNSDRAYIGVSCVSTHNLSAWHGFGTGDSTKWKLRGGASKIAALGALTVDSCTGGGVGNSLWSTGNQQYVVATGRPSFASLWTSSQTAQATLNLPAKAAQTVALAGHHSRFVRLNLQAKTSDAFMGMGIGAATLKGVPVPRVDLRLSEGGVSTASIYNRGAPSNCKGVKCFKPVCIAGYEPKQAPGACCVSCQPGR